MCLEAAKIYARRRILITNFYAHIRPTDTRVLGATACREMLWKTEPAKTIANATNLSPRRPEPVEAKMTTWSTMVDSAQGRLLWRRFC